MAGTTHSVQQDVVGFTQPADTVGKVIGFGQFVLFQPMGAQVVGDLLEIVRVAEG